MSKNIATIYIYIVKEVPCNIIAHINIHLHTLTLGELSSLVQNQNQRIHPQKNFHLKH